MRIVNKIIFHCAESRTNQDFSIEDVRNWHVNGNGWSDIGYHFYIKLDGSLYNGRPIEKVGSHCKGKNRGSVGVCFEGGYKAEGSKIWWDKPTDNQIETAKKLINNLRDKYGFLSIHGHYEFSSKSCPNFDVCILE